MLWAISIYSKKSLMEGQLKVSTVLRLTFTLFARSSLLVSEIDDMEVEMGNKITR